MTCWVCDRAHTGSVWCPHCSAPVDPGSVEAQRSPYWASDPRNPSAPQHEHESLVDMFPEGHPMRAWMRALNHARRAGDLEACLQLRREDAEQHRIPVDLALNEERGWHARNPVPA